MDISLEYAFLCQYDNALRWQ